MTAQSLAIEATGLTKRFGDFLTVDGVSFAVERGEIFGFLGPNGAGKSTTVRMLTGDSQPTEGVALAEGRDVRADPLAVKACVADSDHIRFPAGNTANLRSLRPCKARRTQGWRGTPTRLPAPLIPSGASHDEEGRGST